MINLQHVDYHDAVCDDAMQIWSSILQSRLIRPNTIDFKIGAIPLLDPKVDHSKFCHRFLGLISYDSTYAPEFILFGKDQPDGEVTHLFPFYINQHQERITRLTWSVCNKYFRQVCRLKPMIGVVNVRTQLPKHCWFSVMIEAIDFLAGDHLLTNFAKVRYLHSNFDHINVGPRNAPQVDFCPNELGQEFIRTSTTIAEEYRAWVRIAGGITRPHHPKFVMFKSSGHWVSFFYHQKPHQTGLFLLLLQSFHSLDFHLSMKIVAALYK